MPLPTTSPIDSAQNLEAMTLDNMSDNTFESKNCEVSSPAPAQTTPLVGPSLTSQQRATAPLGDTFRVLLCLIEGDSTVFQVKATINDNVLDLKDLIYDKGISEKRDVLAEDLVLWKVRTPQRSA
jgi:hypothetical protein